MFLLAVFFFEGKRIGSGTARFPRPDQRFVGAGCYGPWVIASQQSWACKTAHGGRGLRWIFLWMQWGLKVEDTGYNAQR